MSLDPMQLGSAVLLGIAVATLLWALRGRVSSRWRRDNAWVASKLYQFSPEPRDPKPYVIGMYLAIFGSFFVLLFLTLNPYLAAALMILVAFAPRYFVNRAWEKRRKKVDEQLPAAVTQMANGVGSGMTLVQAIDRLAERSPDPIRTEFRIISNQWKMGADLIQSIEEAKRRLELPNFSLFSSALSINQQMGGNVVTTLDRLGSSLESIHEMQQEIMSATAEGRMSIKVLAAAPAIMLFLIAFIDFGAVVLVFTEPFGRILLGIAGLLTAAGVLWAWKIVNADI